LPGSVRSPRDALDRIFGRFSERFGTKDGSLVETAVAVDVFAFIGRARDGDDRFRGIGARGEQKPRQRAR
jgi:hypothetical protein